MSRQSVNPDLENLTLVIAAFERLWKINPEDIEADWIDAMAKRLLSEINRQLASVEAIKYDNKTGQPLSGERLINARTLATLRDTLEKVSRLRAQHETVLEQRKERDHGNARTALEHRAVQFLARKRKKSVS